MSVNAMKFEDSSALLNSIVKQATGVSNVTATSEADFVSIATTALNSGYDPLTTAISQVVGRTIFSQRAYNGVLTGLRKDSQQWGGITRKVNYLDGEFHKNVSYDLKDNDTTDMDMYNAPNQKVVQTNFYGGNTFSIPIKIYKNQIDSAFHSSSEFGSYMAGFYSNVQNQINQVREGETRAALLNLIAGKVSADSGNVIKLLTEYRNATGNATITAANVYSEAEFPYFAKWLYGFMNTKIALMAERSSIFHQNISTYNGTAVNPIMRHTPRRNMKCYMLNDLMMQINSSVLSSVFHENMLKYVDFEPVAYWQGIKSPSEINITPVTMTNTGAYQTASAAVNKSTVVGVLFDEEAAGITTIHENIGTTPFNPRGEFWVTWYNFNERWYNDFTENCIVLTLE